VEIRKEFQMFSAHKQMEKEDEFYKFEEKNVYESTSQSEDFMMSESHFNPKRNLGSSSARVASFNSFSSN
jgi:hypothetical protein